MSPSGGGIQKRPKKAEATWQKQHFADLSHQHKKDPSTTTPAPSPLHVGRSVGDVSRLPVGAEELPNHSVRSRCYASCEGKRHRKPSLCYENVQAGRIFIVQFLITIALPHGSD